MPSTSLTQRDISPQRFTLLDKINSSAHFSSSGKEYALCATVLPKYLTGQGGR
jgi:hypothetical protein